MNNAEDAPSTEESAEGARYRFRNVGAGRGEVLGPAGELLWRYGPPPNWLNVFNGPLRGPDLVLFSAGGNERLSIHRERTFPQARFELIGVDGSTLGLIERMSILSTYYTAKFETGNSWIFRLPAFTTDFEGRSDGGAFARIHLESEPVWDVLVDEGNDSPELIASLAFIHSERCRW